MGQAGAIEFYFTVMSVLVKILFMIEHPNSHVLLSQDEYQKDGDHNVPVAIPGRGQE